LEIIHQVKGNELSKSVATIGIFDGVHKAHKEILTKLRQKATSSGLPSVVVTMWPHPRKVLFPEKQLQLLTTFDEKVEILSNQGIDYLLLLPFSKELANTSYQDFIDFYLHRAIGAQYIIIGYNHHFGKGREGSYEALQNLGNKYQYLAERLEPVHVDKWKISSSLIREKLLGGKVDIAEQLLGYRYSVRGSVVKGNQLGGKIGFPTANLQITEADKLIPANGVYAVTVTITGMEKPFGGMMNIGTRPTVSDSNKKVNMEVNLFDFEGDLYGQTIKVDFISHIRNEIKFSGIDQLASQIARDRETAKSIIYNAGL